MVHFAWSNYEPCYHYDLCRLSLDTEKLVNQLEKSTNLFFVVAAILTISLAGLFSYGLDWLIPVSSFGLSVCHHFLTAGT